MKSNLYVVNTSSNTVATNGTVPFSTIVRRRNSNINLTGTNVTVSDCHTEYYFVNANITFTAATADTASLALFINGVEYPGAVSSVTVGTATTEVNTLNIQAIVRTNCNSSDYLTIVNIGTPTLTVTNADMSVIAL